MKIITFTLPDNSLLVMNADNFVAFRKATPSECDINNEIRNVVFAVSGQWFVKDDRPIICAKLKEL